MRPRISLPGRSRVDVFYSKGHTKLPLPPTADPLEGLLNLLNGARREIVFGIYSLTSPEIAQALIDARGRGVPVWGVCDGVASLAGNSKIPQLRSAKIDILGVGSAYSLMHLKVAVVDHMRTASGSYNWTSQAERSNDEILTIIVGRKLATVVRTVLQEIRQANQAPS